MSETIQPWSEPAERAVIGAALVSHSLVSDLLRMVTVSDFRSPNHQHIWAAIEARAGRGDKVDPTVIAGDVASYVTDAPSLLADCLVGHASAASAITHARTVGDLAAVRKIEALADNVVSRIRHDNARDPALLLDSLEADLANVELPNDPRPPEGLWVAADLLAADFPEPPWVIPGFLREAWRCVFVGLEGQGKSTMLRQCAVGVASGTHPFTEEIMDEQPALIVDTENPESVVRDGLKLMRPQAERANLMVWSKPGGIDIRSRRDRDELHKVFEMQRPKLCTVGPLYKLYRTRAGESDEDAAVGCQQVLDELRVTYGCAMMIETHAPKGNSFSRELIPFGSSAWLRWPELGWKLIPCDQQGTKEAAGTSLLIGRFRGDRVKTEVPEWFDRGTPDRMPWRAYWGHKGQPRGWAV